jgi:uncharacterized protein YjbI with pentapeptide repeats
MLYKYAKYGNIQHCSLKNAILKKCRCPKSQLATSPAMSRHGMLKMTLFSDKKIANSGIRYSTLLYATLRYSTLLYATLRYFTLLYATLRYSTLLYATLRYSTLLYSTLLYSTLRYATLRYSALLYATLRFFFATLHYSTL